MVAKGKPRPAQRPPASPLSKGGPRGVGATLPPFARGDRRGVAAKPASPLSKGGPRGVAGRSSSLLDTRIIYCGDCLDQLRKLPDACVDLIYIDPPLTRNNRVKGPPFNSNRNYEVFWGELSEPRAQASGTLVRFEDRHASTQAYIEYMRPRCIELARVLKKTGSFYYHCDWQASRTYRRCERGTRS